MGDNPPEKSRARAEVLRYRVRMSRKMQTVRRLLDAGEPYHAARELMDGHRRGLIPPTPQLPQWLSHVLGTESCDDLLTALAQLPCPHCQGGAVDCGACHASGMDDDDVVCTRCVGTGRARCSSCSGTGLGRLEHVPASLATEVLERRVVLAREKIEELRPSDDAYDDEETHTARVRRLEDDLQRIARQLRILERSVVAALRLMSAEKQTERELADIVRSACRTGVKAEWRLQALLRKMGAGCRKAAEAAENIPQEDERFAAFYEQLSTSQSFAGTGLEHSLLRDATSRLLGKLASWRSRGESEGES